MCGVFAAFNIDRGLNKDHVLSASSLLNHRGPDNQDFAFREDGKLFLHHSRLKIIDLMTLVINHFALQMEGIL